MRASTLPPRTPQIEAPYTDSQPRNSQLADSLADSQYRAQLDESRDAEPEMPDDLIDEYEYEMPANASLRELDPQTPNAAPRIPSLLELDLSVPAALRTNQSHATPSTRPRRNARAPARYDSLAVIR